MTLLSRRSFLIQALALLPVALCGISHAAEIPTPVPGKRVALSGYDPVSYFARGRPERGSREFWFAFDDAVYLFSDAKHRVLFAANPERYAPQYDGYCTMKMSTAERAEADPEAWTISTGSCTYSARRTGSRASTRIRPPSSAKRTAPGSRGGPRGRRSRLYKPALRSAVRIRSR